MPTSNIPTFNDAAHNYDAVPMILNSGGTLNLDFSSAFNDSLWGNASRTQFTVGDGVNTVTLNINNMRYFARNGVDSSYVVNSGSVLNFNGNLAEYPDADLNKNGFFNIYGGSMVVSGIATANAADWDENVQFNFNENGGSLTMAFGGSIYAGLTDVTDDFGTIIKSSLGTGALSAVDNGNGTFTVIAVPEPTSSALLGLGGLALLLRRKK